MRAAWSNPYCIPHSPKFPEKVLIEPGNAFPTKAVAAAKNNQFESSGFAPVFIAAIPTTRLNTARMIAGITYANNGSL